MVLQRLRVAVALPILLLTPSHGAYFYLEEGTEKCFKENVPEHQVLKAQYGMLDTEVFQTDGSKKPAECKIIVKDPQEKIVKEHAVTKDNAKGKLAYVSQLHGEHDICLICTQKEWFHNRKMRWSISFDILGTDGGEATTAAEVQHQMSQMTQEKALGSPDRATVEQVKGTQGKVQELIERVEAISAENEYEKMQEADFRDQSEAVNSRVSWFSLLEILLIGGCTAFQILHLSSWLKRHQLFDACLPFRR